MLGEGYGSPDNVLQVLKRFSWAKNRTKRDADDDKRASMTMNEGEGSSQTPLYDLHPTELGPDGENSFRPAFFRGWRK